MACADHMSFRRVASFVLDANCILGVVISCVQRYVRPKSPDLAMRLSDYIRCRHEGFNVWRIDVEGSTSLPF